VVGVPALEHHRCEVGIEITSRSLCRLDALGSLHDWNGDAHVFGEADLRVRPTARADRLNGESMTEDRVMPHLVELAVRQPQPRPPAEVQGFPAADLHVEPLVAALDERSELINREEVLHAIAELLCARARVVGEGLGGVLRYPTAVLVLERLWQIPVIERGE